MSSGYVLRLCLQAMSSGYAFRLCLHAMSSGFAFRLCFQAMSRAMSSGYVFRLCLQAMSSGYVLRLCPQAMSTGYLYRLCPSPGTYLPIDGSGDPTATRARAALRWRACDGPHTPVKFAELGEAGGARLKASSPHAEGRGPGRQPHGRGAADAPLPPAGGAKRALAGDARSRRGRRRRTGRSRGWRTGRAQPQRPV